MAPGGSDDEADSCVFFGTPLVDLLPEDAKFSVKPKRVEEQIVTDEKGRQRFHGAFTGGFSAGYFNTVGSKEGWAPSTFKSSRNERQGQKGQRPEDFMDEEDFDDHGIAPKSIRVKSDYQDPSLTEKSSRIAIKASDYALEDLIRPTQNTIGVRMLRKMGWREGQGIGPKIKRKLRKLKAKLTHEPGKKLYGVALPTQSDEEEEEDEELEDEYLVSTFNTEQFQFEVKEDYFGLGYKRLDVGNLFGKGSSGESGPLASKSTSDKSSDVHESPAASLLFPMINKSDKKSNKKGISGHAFGIGDFEDDEDAFDVYKQDSIETYDFDLDGQGGRDVRKALNKSYGFNADSDLDVIKLFKVSSEKQMPPKIYPPPVVPAGFNLRHRLEKRSRFDDRVGSRGLGASANDNDDMSTYIKSVSKRSEILGEEVIQPHSVLDLVSPADREFLKSRAEQTKARDEAANNKETSSAQEMVKNKSNEKIAPENEKEMKEKRYESFISYIKKGYKDPYSFVESKELTEWEKTREKEEFERRYDEHLKKIESIKRDASKAFVSLSKLTETNQEVTTATTSESATSSKKTTIDATEFTKPLALLETETSGVELTDIQKAAKEKRYGEATRSEFVWRPHPIVCKRFNVKNPFPEAKEFGTVKEEKRKGTIKEFNMLNLMSAASRFDRGKSKSLFAEINADSNVVVGLQTAQQQPKTNDEGKQQLEWDKKSSEATSSNDYVSILEEEVQKPVAKKPTLKEVESTGIDMENNVYLQERPSFDIFKEIFENEEEEEDGAGEKEKDGDSDVDEAEKEEENEPLGKKVEETRKNGAASSYSVVKSSIGDLDVNVINKYLGGSASKNQQNDYKDDDDVMIIAEPQIPEKIMFKKLVENLASKAASSSSSDSSSSSSSGSEELVYEEVSVSSSSGKKAKKKKKHHHHHHHKKKKSKKSHKKSKK